MCGGGGIKGALGDTLDILKHPTDLNRWIYGGSGHYLGRDPYADDGVKKPPKADINTELTANAAQHAKDLQALAFGISDTKLTNGTGLGSVPKSLLLPKTSLGGS